MNTITKEFVSDKTVAERLEVFEENLRLQDELAAARDKLKAKDLAHTEELSRLRHQATDPIQHAIDILQSHQQQAAQLVDAERQRDLFNAENDEMRQTIDELRTALDDRQRHIQHYKAECEKLLAKHNSEVSKAQAEIDRQQRQLALYAQEVKDLRALNPQRLAKQVKELQKKNKEHQEANQQLRVKVNENQKIRKEHEERGRVIDKLYSDNRNLDAALSEACLQLNEGAKLTPIETHGDWEIYAHNDGTEALILHHTPTDSSRVFWAGEGFRKLPALPPKVKARAEEMIANYVNTKAGMTDYAAGERVEVA